MKSAYEIALEKADNLVNNFQGDESLEKKERIKPILAQFFKGKINADGLWQELKKEDDPEVYIQAQLILINSLGLQASTKDIEERKKGILAVETLKTEQKCSLLEQILNQIANILNKYTREKEKLEEQLEEIREQKSEMKMRPVQTQDGNTVMQIESDLDEETKNSFAQEFQRFESLYNNKFNQLIKSLKEELE